jgi:ribosome recycling factor
VAELDLADLERRMGKALEALKHEFGGLRTGRASTSMLDPIHVLAYGASMPLNQVATINVPEPRMLSVQVWDKANVKAVDKAIREGGLGLNPQTDGTLIRIPIPELNEQRRRELTKVAGQYAEHARVAVRNIRREGMDEVKKMLKDGDLSEDEQTLYQDEIQSLTDAAIKKIDDALAGKQKEIMQV